jgi:hypothetical protein
MRCVGLMAGAAPAIMLQPSLLFFIGFRPISTDLPNTPSTQTDKVILKNTEG